MSKQVRATDAKNNFGGFLEDVATFGRVEIVRHGRVVAVVLSPLELEGLSTRKDDKRKRESTHMIPAALARAARIVSEPTDETWE